MIFGIIGNIQPARAWAQVASWFEYLGRGHSTQLKIVVRITTEFLN
jgi:hypothetical protein